MSNSVSDMYKTLMKKLTIIETSIKLCECSDEFKEDFKQRLEHNQIKIDQLKALQDENANMRNSLLEKLGKLQENRKYIEDLRKLLPVSIVNVSESSDQSGNCLSKSYAEEGKHYIDLTPIQEKNHLQKPYKIHFDNLYEIAQVEPEEFESIPQYMRGRQHVEALNKFIEKINSVVEDKYNLLKLKKNEVPRDRVRQYIEFKKLQGATENNLAFITPTDLGLKQIDKQTNTYLAMLRHIRRIKEVREGGVLKICLIN